MFIPSKRNRTTSCSHGIPFNMFMFSVTSQNERNACCSGIWNHLESQLLICYVSCSFAWLSFPWEKERLSCFQLIMLSSISRVHAHKWHFQECCLNLCSASVSATYSRSLVSESIICLLEGPSCLWVWSQQRPDRSCWCCFLSLTGNWRSELRPPDEHCGTLPSAASRYGPPATHNRSISRRSGTPSACLNESCPDSHSGLRGAASATYWDRQEPSLISFWRTGSAEERRGFVQMTPCDWQWRHRSPGVFAWGFCSVHFSPPRLPPSESGTGLT